jgi:hypothetical protein
MKKKKVDPAKQAEKVRKDAARMEQMGEATASQQKRQSASAAKDHSRPVQR